MRVDVSVIAPVYGNGRTLRELVDRIHESCTAARLTYETLLVDDASRDDSWSTIAELASTRPHVRGLRLGQNHGQHFTILAGWAAARGRCLVALDADLQDPPEAIPELVRHLGRFDVVFAGRRGQYQSRSRMVTSSWHRRMLPHLTGVPPDSGLFLAVAADVLPQLLGRRVRPRPAVLALIGAANLRIHTVPVQRGPARGTTYTHLTRLRSWASLVRGAQMARIPTAPAVLRERLTAAIVERAT
jgi:glycosyltransferase involved in cell wall biosynthesis